MFEKISKIIKPMLGRTQSHGNGKGAENRVGGFGGGWSEEPPGTATRKYESPLCPVRAPAPRNGRKYLQIV